MICSDDIASLFGFNDDKNKGKSWHTVATVRSVNAEGDFVVRLTPGVDTTAVAMCSASVGSRVMVLVLNGTAYAIASKG